MKTNHIQYIITILILFSFASCENDFNVDMKEEYVVLHGLAFEGESPKIILAKTLEVFPKYPFNLQYYNQPFYDENVEIIVTSGNETYTNFKTHQIPIEKSEWDNNYRLSTEIIYFSDDNFIPEVGKEYTIEVYELETYPIVKRSGFSLKSTTKIPIKAPISITQLPDKLNESYSYYNPEETIYNQVYSASFQDPETDEDYYYITFSEVICENDFSMDTIDMDKLWNNPVNYKESDCWLRNLKFYYENNHNAISGLGERGQDEEDYGTELQGYLLSDSDFNGQTKTINVELDGYSYTADKYHYLVVELFHISKEYYNYYKTLQTQGSTQDDIFAEPIQIYTNIDGGLGVFAGASLSTQYIKIKPMPN